MNNKFIPRKIKMRERFESAIVIVLFSVGVISFLGGMWWVFDWLANG